MTTPVVLNTYVGLDDRQAFRNHQIAIDVGLVAHMRYTPATDPYAYAEALAQRWNAGRTFVVAEHDIVATPGKLAELIDCRHPWCACVYRYPDRADLVAGLGLTKFDERILHATADLVDDLRRLRWSQLDDYLFRVLSKRGFMRHLHGRVEHVKGV